MINDLFGKLKSLLRSQWRADQPTFFIQQSDNCCPRCVSQAETRPRSSQRGPRSIACSRLGSEPRLARPGITPVHDRQWRFGLPCAARGLEMLAGLGAAVLFWNELEGVYGV